MTMNFPGWRCKTLTLSYDDGVEQDIKLIDIMNKNGLKGTFNLNSGLFAEEGTVFPEGQIHRRLTKSGVLGLYKDSGHEVAIHALTHPFLERLPVGTVAYEIAEDRRRLEEMFGVTVRGMAYPFGTTSDTVVEVLKNSGIVYSRTTVSTEKFDLPKDWLRLPATCHHKNPRLMELAEEFLNMPETGYMVSPKMFYLWGHSYEFEGDNNWHVIEEFAKKMGGRENIWYATNLEIYDYINACKQLRIGVDMNIIENPTALDIYFELENEKYMVPAGKTITIGRV